MKPLDRLAGLRDQADRLVIGLSSGTSADGVDAALVRITGDGVSTRVELMAGRTYPYEPVVKDAILRLPGGSVAEVCRMNFVLGELFAEAAIALAKEAGLRRDEIDLIGSHGQTIYHIPRDSHHPASTLQVGEADVIAERTRVPVISGFRTRDVAAGGDGAPLVPYVDFLLFGGEGGPLALQNIGGIANVTVVGPDIEDLIAFDTGPGNMPLDHVVSVLTRGQETFDRGGKHAARGRIDETLVQRLLDDPWFSREPPKSTGRERFGEAYVMRILEGKGNLSVLDVLASLTLCVAWSIHRAYADFVFPHGDIREILVILIISMVI